MELFILVKQQDDVLAWEQRDRLKGTVGPQQGNRASIDKRLPCRVIRLCDYQNRVGMRQNLCVNAVWGD